MDGQTSPLIYLVLPLQYHCLSFPSCALEDQGRERKSTPREPTSTLAFYWKQEGGTLKQDAGQNILEVQTLILQCRFRAKFLWKVPVLTTLLQKRKSVRLYSRARDRGHELFFGTVG